MKGLTELLKGSLEGMILERILEEKHTATKSPNTSMT